MKIAHASAVLLLTGLAGSAGAGQANFYETSVDMATGVGIGSLADTRRSADNVQYIGCDVYVRAPHAARVLCFAKSTTAGPLSCSSNRPEFVTAGTALTDHGFVRFKCAGDELTERSWARHPPGCRKARRTRDKERRHEDRPNHRRRRPADRGRNDHRRCGVGEVS
jgi:hypothetical protein